MSRVSEVTTKAKRPQRSSAMKAVADENREALLDALVRVQIVVPRYEFAQVREAAVQHYNLLWAERGKYEKGASIHSDPKFLERITLNFIRHQLTRYAGLLAAIQGKIGKAEAYQLLKARVIEEIHRTYPELAGSAPSPSAAASQASCDEPSTPRIR